MSAKKLTLTAIMLYMLRNCLRDMRAVLQQIKSRPLAGKALEDMKILEEAVTYLEIFILGKDGK
jgi:hypothetical protein